MILVSISGAAEVVRGGQHLLSSLRLEANLQKGFIRLYDFLPPHSMGGVWVFQCSERSRPLPLSERIADRDYAELAVEKVRLVNFCSGCIWNVSGNEGTIVGSLS